MPVYISALYTLTQGTYEKSLFGEAVGVLCKGRKEIKEAKIHKQDIGKTAAEVLPTALIFDRPEGAKMDDILFADYDDDDDISDYDEEDAEEELKKRQKRSWKRLTKT